MVTTIEIIAVIQFGPSKEHIAVIVDNSVLASTLGDCTGPKEVITAENLKTMAEAISRYHKVILQYFYFPHMVDDIPQTIMNAFDDTLGRLSGRIKD